MWLELIRVRVKEADVEQKSDEFWETLSPVELPPGLTGYSVYTNGAHQNEVMLVLNWESPQAASGGSDLARSIAEMLKEFGMVSRSTWKNKTNRVLGSPNGWGETGRTSI